MITAKHVLIECSTRSRRHARFRVALGMVAAAFGLGSCSPIAPSLFKDSNLGSPHAPLAGLAPTSSSQEKGPDGTPEGGEEGGWSSSLGAGSAFKLVSYTTLVEVGSDTEDCAEGGCSPAHDALPAEKRLLTVTFGEPLIQQLVQRGEARFSAALDFIPTTVKARLKLRPSLSSEPSPLVDATNADELEWGSLNLLLEPQVILDATHSHWIARLPATLTERQLTELRKRLVSVDIEFQGEEAERDPEIAALDADETQSLPSPTPSLTGVPLSPKAILKPTATSTATGPSVR